MDREARAASVRLGEYVVYVDESGDHGLAQINPEFPHDMVVLHEREIRKALAPFGLLLDAQVRADFMDRLTGVVQSAPFIVVASAIRKNEFKERRGTALNPYNVALEYGLERVFFQLQDRGQVGRKTAVIFESRGSNEDHQLELEFRRITDATKVNGMAQTLEFPIANKQVNSSRLQLADMVARPIALKIMRPKQPNRAWDMIEPKTAKSAQGVVTGYGLKVYP